MYRYQPCPPRAHSPLTACCVAGAPLQAGSKAAGSSCGADSRANPVQSLSNSGYFSAAGLGSDSGSWLAAGENSRLGALGPSAESSYASALPVSAFRCQSVMCLAATSMQPAPYFVGGLYCVRKSTPCMGCFWPFLQLFRAATAGVSL
jgi:hypothetical protein